MASTTKLSGPERKTLSAARDHCDRMLDDDGQGELTPADHHKAGDALHEAGRLVKRRGDKLQVTQAVDDDFAKSGRTDAGKL